MQATEIMMQARNAGAAMTAAEKAATSVDQDWENEATLYTFHDESVLVVSGPQCNAYAGIAEARDALAQ